MAWTYDPKDATECLPEGEYPAELTSVEEKTSKKGNPMLELVWTVMHNGRQWQVRDWIVQPATVYKLKSIARAWAMLGDFDAGRFDLAAQTGRAVMLTLTVQVQDGYADRNSVAGVKAMPAGYTPAAGPAAEPKDEGIPF